MGIGSPPRAWGQRATGRAGLVSSRFTPTRMGTTSRASSSGTAPSVHPHTRGDNDTDEVAGVTVGGSPPHAWGQLELRDFRHRPARFTPTRVGTMAGGNGPGSTFTVHPHARGDNGAEIAANAMGIGSPPHAWGQRWACSSMHWWRPVHPHAHGDNYHVLDCAGEGIGSPLVRGAIIDPAHGSPPPARGQRYEGRSYYTSSLRAIQALP